MNCAKCNDPIPNGEECNYLGKALCEDCYILALSPPKTCDVAAVHSAKKHRESMGQRGTDGLTDLQKNIVDFVNDKGKATKAEIAAHFELKGPELDKQFAVLRHCEVLKARKEPDNIYIVAFDA
jgi:hypothetical protein